MAVSKKYSGNVAFRNTSDMVGSKESNSLRNKQEEIFNRIKEKRSIGLKTIGNDISSVNSSVIDSLSNWKDKDTMSVTKEKLTSMLSRATSYRDYVNKNQNEFNNLDIQSFNKEMDSLLSFYGSALDSWDNYESVYSQYKDADSYKRALDTYEWGKANSGLSAKEVQRRLNDVTVSDKDKEYLKKYGLNVGYNSVSDYDADLAYQKEMLGQNKEQEDYIKQLETKRNQYDLDNRFTKYAPIMERDDFEEKSKYVSTVKEKPNKVYEWTGGSLGHIDKEQDDLYEYVNNVDGARGSIEYEHSIYSMESPSIASKTSGYEEMGLGEMNEDEIAVYNYIYNTEGSDKAKEYLEDMKTVWNKRSTDNMMNTIDRIADNNGALISAGLSALSVPMRIIGGIESTASNIGSLINGEELNPYSSDHALTNISEGIRKSVGSNIAEETEGAEIFGTNVGEFAYNTGLSIAESLLGAKAFGKAFTGIMGMSASAQRVKELKDAGASEEQVVLGSVASGVAEAFFEKFSIDNFLKAKDASTLAKGVKETIKQMGIEGSEEFATELANVVSDTIIRQNTSDVMNMYNDLLERGYSETEAKGEVAKQIASQVAWATVGGAISGGVMGSFSAVRDYHELSNTGRQLRENGTVGDLGNLASVDTSSLSDAEIGSLYRQTGESVSKAYDEEMLNSVRNKVTKRLISLGIDNDTAVKMGDIITRQQTGGRVNSAEKNLLKTRTAQRVISEMEHSMSNDYSNRWTSGKVSKQAVKAERSMNTFQNLSKAKADTDVKAEEIERSINTGDEAANIEGVAVHDGEVYVKTVNGEKIATEVTMTPAQAKVFSYAAQMDTVAGDAMIKNYDGSTDAEEYINAFTLAETYGENGYGNENVLKDKGVLTPTQALEAYKAGIRVRNVRIAEKQQNEITAKTEAFLKEIGKNGVTFREGTFNDSVVNYDKISVRQKSAIELTKIFSKVTGVNIEYIESKLNEDGTRTGENGRYDPNKNTVYLDVYAGLGGSAINDSIIPTLSHEVTHWMKDKAPEVYTKLSEAVANALTSDGKTSIQDILAKEIVNYEARHDGKTISEESAMDELIARTCEDMLSNSQYAKELMARSDAATRSSIIGFMKKVKDSVERIRKWISDLLGSYKSNSKEAEFLRGYDARLDEISKIWDKMLKESITANQAMQRDIKDTTGSDDTRYSERESYVNEAGDTVVIIDKYFSKSKVRNNDRYVENQVKEILLALNGKKITVKDNGNDIYFDKYFADEYTGSNDTVHSNDKFKAAKMNAATKAEEIVRNAVYRTWKESKKSNRKANADRGFDYYDVFFAYNESYNLYTEFGGLLIVRKDKNGKDYAYDITNVRKKGSVALHADKISVRGKKPNPGNNISDTDENVNTQFSENNKDIRFSERNIEENYDTVDEIERLRKENEKLKSDVELFKKKLSMERKLTEGKTLNENRLAESASYLLKMANSKYDKRTLMDELRSLYTHIMNAEQLSFDDIMPDINRIARNLVENEKPAVMINDYYKTILREIRNTKITLDDAQRQEAEMVYGGKGAMHKSTFGRVKIGNDGISLDTKWQEWSRMYPDIFDENINSAEMLTELMSIYDDLRRASEVAQYYNDAERYRQISHEVYNQFWNMSPSVTMEDRLKNEISRLKYEHRQSMKELRESSKKSIEDAKKDYAAYYRKLFEKVREKYKNEVRETRLRGQERMDKMRERKEQNRLVETITRRAKRINDKLIANDAKKHIPDVLKKPVIQLLASLDFTSRSMLEQGRVTEKEISLAKAFEQVRRMASQIENGETQAQGEGFIDLPMGFTNLLDEFKDRLEQMEDNYGTGEMVLNELSTDELTQLNNIISVFEKTIIEANQMVANSRYVTIAEASSDTITDMEKIGKARKGTGKLNDLVVWSNATPIIAFERFGRGGRSIFQSLQDGWDKLAFNTNEVLKFSNEAYTMEEVKKWGKEIHEFDVGENKIEMTTAQIMSLYCLSKREQAMKHLLGDGIRIGKIDNRESQVKGTKLSKGIIQEIIGTLDARQIEVADKLQNFMSTTCADWGNVVSQIRFGIDLFGEKNYFPIESDENYIGNAEPKERQKSLYRLLNLSFTKKLNDHAVNRIVVNDIFDVFAQHTSDMAKYNALALPILDALKWYNYVEKGTEDNPVSVQESLESAYGEGAKRYFTTFMEDINAVNNTSFEEGALNQLVSAYKIAAVGANLRVVALQPTSYFRASALMDVKYLISGLRKSRSEQAIEKSGIAMWKSLGFYDTNINRSVQKMIKHDYTVRETIAEKSLALAGKADEWTWGHLWSAVEAEIKDKNPMMNTSSDEFNEKVSERFREVIYKTQVVDSTMTRTQVMRNKHMSGITAFMSEPSITFNCLMSIFDKWNAEARRTNKATAFRKYGKQIARMAAVYVVSNTMAAIVEGAFDAWRDDDDEKEIDEKLLENFFDNLGDDLNPLTKLPFVKDAWSILVDGWDVSRMDTEIISSFATAFKKLEKQFEKGGEGYKSVYYSLKAVSSATGIPASNLLREVVTIWNNTIGNVYDSMRIK